MDKAKVVQALNLDLEHEMSAMILYLHHSFIVAGPGRGPLVNLFRQRAQDCMIHD
jgi:bacterioferritin (cytochrome b1)